jgi:hypothetical protein
VEIVPLLFLLQQLDHSNLVLCKWRPKVKKEARSTRSIFESKIPERPLQRRYLELCS